MTRGIKRHLSAARKRVEEEIRANTDQNSLYSRGLASEGYAGGYLAALDDIALVLNGVRPNSRYWEDMPENRA